MGFVSQIIILSLLAFLSHYLDVYRGRRLKDPAWLINFSNRTVMIFMLYAILMYTGVLNFLIPILNNIPWVNYADCKEYMWNSGQLIGLPAVITHQDGLNIIAVFLIFSYIPTFFFWKKISQFLFGEKTYERGVWYALEQPKKKK